MGQEELIAEFLALPRYAVVGVSTDHKKFGYIIWRNLQKKGYDVYPVNPRYDTIEGERCYRSLAEVADRVDVVDVVVPPQVTEQIVRQCAELGLTRVWLQPGAESEEAIRFAEEHGVRVVHHVCAMALSGPRPEARKRTE
jgi:predicted CoA-binding protein